MILRIGHTERSLLIICEFFIDFLIMTQSINSLKSLLEKSLKLNSSDFVKNLIFSSSGLSF